MTNAELAKKINELDVKLDDVILEFSRFKSTLEERDKQAQDKKSDEKDKREVDWRWMIFITSLIIFTVDHIGSIFAFFRGK